MTSCQFKKKSTTVENDIIPVTKSILIDWTDNLPGDFSFRNVRSHPDAVNRNEFGQLVCDGLCPEASYRMLDENGKIYQDSVEAYYKIIDTTHLFHSIHSEARCYEFAGTDYFTIKKIINKNERYEGYTQMNVATHSSLKLKIIKEKCYPVIELNSVTATGIKIYPCKAGQIKIDRKLWKNGIMKSVFDFTFEDNENPNEEMFWKGKIFTKIEDEQ